MMVLIDTSIWSIGFRRQQRDLSPVERALFFQWRDPLVKGDAAMIGPILLEILSGIADPHVFTSLRQQLEAVTELPVDRDVWILAAEFYNACRSAGIAPGAIDMTICATGSSCEIPIFSSDPDFLHYARILPIALLPPPRPAA